MALPAPWQRYAFAFGAIPCLLLLLSATLARAAGERKAVDIFGDALGPGFENWSWNADITFGLDDAQPSRSAIVVNARPWGALSLYGRNEWRGDRLLDLQAKGDLSSAALMLQDFQGTNLWTRPVTIADTDLYTIVSPPDSNGWMRLQVPLSGLLPKELEGLPVEIKPEALSWNRIALVDVSGEGFSCMLARIRLLPPSRRLPPYTESLASVEKVPVPPVFETTFRVFGAADVAKNWIVRLVEPSPTETVDELCGDLEGIGARGGGLGVPEDSEAACSTLPEDEFLRSQDLTGKIEAEPVPMNASQVIVRGNVREMRQLAKVQRTAIAYIEEDQPAVLHDCEGVGQSRMGSSIPWGIDRINQDALPLDGSFSSTLSGLGVDVFVLDTGLRATHREFASRSGSVGLGFNARSPGDPPSDRNGHGTSAASIIGGRQYGVAPDATIRAVKVMGDNGSGFFSDIIKGMSWVVGQRSRRPQVVNLSIGGPRSRALNDATRDLLDAGFIVVTSAGNSAGDACSFSPASQPGVASVAASDIEDHMASFSNRGACVSLFAPGVSVPSASASSDTARTLFTGTSAASPMVAGAAALYLEGNPNASPAVAPPPPRLPQPHMATPMAAEADLLSLDQGLGLQPLGRLETLEALRSSAADVFFHLSSPSKLLNVARGSYQGLCGGTGGGPSPTPAPTPAPTRRRPDRFPLFS